MSYPQCCFFWGVSIVFMFPAFVADFAQLFNIQNHQYLHWWQWYNHVESKSHFARCHHMTHLATPSSNAGFMLWMCCAVLFIVSTAIAFANFSNVFFVRHIWFLSWRLGACSLAHRIVPLLPPHIQLISWHKQVSCCQNVIGRGFSRRCRRPSSSHTNIKMRRSLAQPFCVRVGSCKIKLHSKPSLHGKILNNRVQDCPFDKT